MARVVKGLFVYGAGFAPVSVVLRFLHFAVSREPQPVYGFGSAEMRDVGTGFLSDAVDRWCKCSRAEACGASPVKNGDL